MHLDLDHAIAFAGLAAPALDVEREPSRAIAALARGRRFGEQFADRREQAGVGGRIAARGASDRALVDRNHLVEVLEAVDAVVCGRFGLRAVKVARDRMVQGVVDQRRLAGARHTRHADQQADRERHVHAGQVVAARTAHREQALARRRAPGRHRDAPRPRQILAGQRDFGGLDLRRRALRHDMAAMLAGARAHVDDVVRGADRVLVVLHDQHRIAQIAQVAKGFDQAVVVALMQADRGLVEHIHDPGQPRADLGGQPDALRFAPREGLGRAVQRQVLQADVVQESQAVDDLAHDPFADRGPVARQHQGVEPLKRIAQGPVRHLPDRAIGAARTYPHMAGVQAQTCALAGRADTRIAVFGQFFADMRRIGLFPAPLEVGDHALEGVLANHVLAVVAGVGEGHALGARAVQHDAADGVGQGLERGVDVEGVERRQAGQHLEIQLVSTVPALDRAGGQRKIGEQHHPFGVEELDHAEPVALGAGAQRVVERKQARLEFAQRVIADRAGEPVGQQLFLAAVHVEHHRPAVGQAQGGLEGLGQALLDRRADLDAVDDHVDRVLLVLAQRQGVLVQVDHPRCTVAAFGAHAHPHEPLRAKVLEQFDMLSLAAGHQGREDHHAGVRRLRERGVDHLGDRLGLEHMRRMLGTVGRAGPREQQAQVVVDLGDRAHGRARVVAGRLLLDRDRRRQAFDHVDVGLLHQLQELPRVGRQRLDIAALPFGIQGIEGERRFSRPRQPGDHHQAIARQVQRDVLEIVRACTANADFVHRVVSAVSGLPVVPGASR